MTAVDVSEDAIGVHLFRDHDPTIAALPGMDIGPANVHGTDTGLVAEWFATGVRRVAIDGVVDLTTGNTASAPNTTTGAVARLALVRELTSHGIAVDWRLHLPGDASDEWRRFRHLFPPAELSTGPDDPHEATDRIAERRPVADALTEWRSRFRIGILHYRWGPDFVLVHDSRGLVRDSRSGSSTTTILDDPAILAALGGLERGHAVDEDNHEPVSRLVAQGLATPVGDSTLWLPCRLRRWPWWLNRFDR